jgi:hypothetical protein
MLLHSLAKCTVLCRNVTDPGRLDGLLLRDEAQLLVLGVTARNWLGRAQGLDLPIRVATAQFCVSGNGQVAGMSGGVFPFLSVVHDLGEGLFSLLVEVA